MIHALLSVLSLTAVVSADSGLNKTVDESTGKLRLENCIWHCSAKDNYGRKRAKNPKWQSQTQAQLEPLKMLSTLTTAESSRILKAANTVAVMTPHRKCPAYRMAKPVTTAKWATSPMLERPHQLLLVRQNQSLLRKKNTRKNASNVARTTITLYTLLN